MFKRIISKAIIFSSIILIVSCGDSIIDTMEKADAEEKIYTIGDTGPGGGIVFYIADGGLHGLEAAQSNQDSVGIRWYNGSYSTTGATSTIIGSGMTNTNTIIAEQGDTAISYATGLARACNDGGKNDWFLPSKNELNLMYANLKNATPSIGGFGVYYYWSSSESSNTLAWFQDFNTGLQAGEDKGSPLRVRAIRAF